MEWKTPQARSSRRYNWRQWKRRHLSCFTLKLEIKWSPTKASPSTPTSRSPKITRISSTHSRCSRSTSTSFKRSAPNSRLVTLSLSRWCRRCTLTLRHRSTRFNKFTQVKPQRPNSFSSQFQRTSNVNWGKSAPTRRRWLMSLKQWKNLFVRPHPKKWIYSLNFIRTSAADYEVCWSRNLRRDNKVWWLWPKTI